MTEWLNNWLYDCLIKQMTEWQTTDSLTNDLNVCIHSMIFKLTDRLTEWKNWIRTNSSLTKWPNGLLTERLKDNCLTEGGKWFIREARVRPKLDPPPPPLPLLPSLLTDGETECWMFNLTIADRLTDWRMTEWLTNSLKNWMTDWRLLAVRKLDRLSDWSTYTRLISD